MLDALIMEIIEREGRKDTNNPNDSGGRTKYGISERANPEAWKNGPPTLDAAKQLYLVKYLVGPKIANLVPDYLRDQVADFAIPSGPHVAIQHLQRLVGVPDDGVLGPATFAALATKNPETIHTLLIDSRVLMFARIVQRRPKDLEFLYGWLHRAFSFRRV